MTSVKISAKLATPHQKGFLLPTQDICTFEHIGSIGSGTLFSIADDSSALRLPHTMMNQLQDIASDNSKLTGNMSVLS
jgi:hypothetical protein